MSTRRLTGTRTAKAVCSHLTVRHAYVKGALITPRLCWRTFLCEGMIVLQLENMHRVGGSGLKEANVFIMGDVVMDVLGFVLGRFAVSPAVKRPPDLQWGPNQRLWPEVRGNQQCRQSIRVRC